MPYFQYNALIPFNLHRRFFRYGGNKLTSDEALASAWDTDQFPYTSIRIPDVYGPFDNLGGFLSSIVVPVLSNKPVATRLPVERRRPRQPRQRRQQRKQKRGGESYSGNSGDDDGGYGHQMSWVYAPDVVAAVMAVVDDGVAPSLRGHVLHIAHEERVTVGEMAHVVARAASNRDDAEALLDPDGEAEMPQHDVGPLSIAKALRVLEGRWRPTPIGQAVRATLEWLFAREENKNYHVRVQRRLQEEVVPVEVVEKVEVVVPVDPVGRGGAGEDEGEEDADEAEEEDDEDEVREGDYGVDMYNSPRDSGTSFWTDGEDAVVDDQLRQLHEAFPGLRDWQESM